MSDAHLALEALFGQTRLATAGERRRGGGADRCDRDRARRRRGDRRARHRRPHRVGLRPGEAAPPREGARQRRSSSRPDRSPRASPSRTEDDARARRRGAMVRTRARRAVTATACRACRCVVAGVRLVASAATHALTAAVSRRRAAGRSVLVARRLARPAAGARSALAAAVALAGAAGLPILVASRCLGVAVRAGAAASAMLLGRSAARRAGARRGALNVRGGRSRRRGRAAACGEAENRDGDAVTFLTELIIWGQIAPSSSCNAPVTSCPPRGAESARRVGLVPCLPHAVELTMRGAAVLVGVLLLGAGCGGSERRRRERRARLPTRRRRRRRRAPSRRVLPPRLRPLSSIRGRPPSRVPRGPSSRGR